MILNITDSARIVGATVGVEVLEVGQHPSGAIIMHTNVGKGYLPDDLNLDDSEAVAEALTSTLQIMKDIADGKYAEPDNYVLTGEQMETCLDALSKETSELALEPGTIEDDVAAMSIVAPEDVEPEFAHPDDEVKVHLEERPVRAAKATKQRKPKAEEPSA